MDDTLLLARLSDSITYCCRGLKPNNEKKLACGCRAAIREHTVAIAGRLKEKSVRRVLLEGSSASHYTRTLHSREANHTPRNVDNHLYLSAPLSFHDRHLIIVSDAEYILTITNSLLGGFLTSLNTILCSALRNTMTVSTQAGAIPLRFIIKGDNTS